MNKTIVKSRKTRKAVPTSTIYHMPAVIEKDEDGYFAYCPILQGCHTQGKTYEKALQNIRDVIQLHIEDRLACGEEIPAMESFAITSLEIAV
jgi:predicted RNase H-like HicB family nuclease